MLTIVRSAVIEALNKDLGLSIDPSQLKVIGQSEGEATEDHLRILGSLTYGVDPG